MLQKVLGFFFFKGEKNQQTKQNQHQTNKKKHPPRKHTWKSVMFTNIGI